MKAVKNIIFDLGGVFLRLDYKKTEQAFISLGVTDFTDLFTFNHSAPLFEKLEKGQVSPQKFYHGFREMTGKDISDEQVKDAWNAMLLDFPLERLDWLSRIKDKYHIYLFSNTNQVHYDHFIETFPKTGGMEHFNHYFIKAYYSHEMGMKKPDVNSYRKILAEQGLVAGETLFIDDTLKNIEGAREAGLQAIHLAAPMTVLELGL